MALERVPSIAGKTYKGGQNFEFDFSNRPPPFDPPRKPSASTEQKSKAEK